MPLLGLAPLAGIGPMGPVELLLILAVVIIIFGVGRLPEVGGAIGKGIREFRKATKEDDEPKQITQAQSTVQSAPPGPESARAAADAGRCLRQVRDGEHPGQPFLRRVRDFSGGARLARQRKRCVWAVDAVKGRRPSLCASTRACCRERRVRLSLPPARPEGFIRNLKGDTPLEPRQRAGCPLALPAGHLRCQSNPLTG